VVEYGRADRLVWRGRKLRTVKGVSGAADERGMELLQNPAPLRLSIGRGAFGPVLLLGALFAWVGASGGVSVTAAAVLGAVGGTASLLVHELGHVRAARKPAGVRPVSVSLTWLGAATRLEGEYASGGEQARVAIAGPTASFAVAAVLTLSLYVLPISLGLKALVLLLALFNVAIGVVNLIPASPLDGYKLVVGLLWSRLGSEAAARRLVRRLALIVTALEVPGAAVLTVEKPLLGSAVIALAAGHFGQKLLVARCRS
jgi:Zn-dependent protease